MASVASLDVDDLRHEMDARAAAIPTGVKRKPIAAGPKPGGIKTSFLIRTLPKDCNPTPVPSVGLNSSASGLLSPMTAKRRGDTEPEKSQQDNPFDDITEEKLKQLSGCQDLTRVMSLQISVDSTKQSVEVIGELLPSLQQLRLQQSCLGSFRDLGTSLRSLRVLWAMHCQITDLDGIGALTNLHELYLQHNNISDISPLTMHEELRVVDLEGNRVEDIGQIEELAFCPQLTALNLAGNPVESVERYRQIIANFVPQLTSLDDKTFSAGERAKLSDEEIDAAIFKQRRTVEVEYGNLPQCKGVPGLNDVSNFRPLSASSSTSSLTGLTPESSDDSGSRLTHGTDIVFAGNVSSALRRHRYETEGGDQVQSPTATSDVRPPSSHGKLDRPKTPARRVSITDTLDRAKEIDADKHKSRDAILDELKAWQIESAGASQVGVPRDAITELLKLNDESSSNRSRRKGSVGGIPGDIAALRANIERRPRTSAGVLRNGANVREAFVEMASAKKNASPRPSSRGGPLQRALTSSRSSTPGVDILILDGVEEDKRPCSPKKTSRGIFTTASSGEKALGRDRDWNLEALSSTVDITTAKRHIPSSLSSKQQRERSLARKTQDNSSDSDSDDELNGCLVAVESNTPRLVPKTAFFNVAESLNAIDKWRDEMEYDAEDTAILNIASLQQDCLSPRTSTPPNSARNVSEVNEDQRSPGNQQQHSPVRQQLQQKHNLALGPANHETDHHLVQILCEKHSQLKTRDGFRSYFRGIEEARLEQILRQAFTDSDRVRRRMQLMSGLFHHELQS